MLLCDCVELFELDCRVRGLSPVTTYGYVYKLRRFCDWSGDGELSQVDRRMIRAWIVHLQDLGYAQQTLHSHGVSLRCFFSFAVREGLLAQNPTDGLPMPRRPRHQLPHLSMAQAQSVLRACTTERDKALVMFLLDTGVRRSELVALDVGDMDRDGTVRVREGKGGKYRVVYAGARTRKQVLRYWLLERGGQPQDGPLFVSFRGGGRLLPRTVNRILDKLRQATGVQCLTPHALRRTYAVMSLRSGMNIYVLAQLMGHSDIATLRPYLLLVQEDGRRAALEHGVVDAMASVDGMG